LCAAAGCSDGFKGPNETDVDCGGACTTKCGTNQACSGGGDCVSANCVGNLCRAATCSDGIRNQGESFADCGGSSGCPRCAPGDTCTAGTDCESKVCGGGTCQAATCGDTAKNQDESDVNCGGVVSMCPRCADGRTCATAGDCDSTRCATTCQNNTVTALYYVWDGDPADGNNHMKIAFGIQNNTGAAIDSGQLRIRYYFSNEPGGTQTADCFIGPEPAPAGTGCDDISNGGQPTFGTGYFELAFNGGGFSVPNNGTSGMFRLMVHRPDWLNNYTQSNDHSYLSRTTPGENRKIVVYLGGNVVYGVAP
jgi:hypothetical protein